MTTPSTRSGQPPALTETEQVTAVRPSTTRPQLPPERARELARLERQMIPVLNSIRAELGKRPVIVPKE